MKRSVPFKTRHAASFRDFAFHAFFAAFIFKMRLVP